MALRVWLGISSATLIFTNNISRLQTTIVVAGMGHRLKSSSKDHSKTKKYNTDTMVDSERWPTQESQQYYTVRQCKQQRLARLSKHTSDSEVVGGVIVEGIFWLDFESKKYSIIP